MPAANLASWHNRFVLALAIPGAQAAFLGQWIEALAAARRAFAGRLADWQSLRIPSPDPGYGDFGPAFPAWPGPQRRDPATPKP